LYIIEYQLRLSTIQYPTKHY